MSREGKEGNGAGWRCASTCVVVAGCGAAATIGGMTSDSLRRAFRFFGCEVRCAVLSGSSTAADALDRLPVVPARVLAVFFLVPGWDAVMPKILLNMASYLSSRDGTCSGSSHSSSSSSAAGLVSFCFPLLLRDREGAVEDTEGSGTLASAIANEGGAASTAVSSVDASSQETMSGSSGSE